MAAHSADDEQEIGEALSHWRQGDFVIGVGELPLLSLPLADDEDEHAFESEEHAGFVAISQSCDLVRVPSRVPYASMCPLAPANEQQLSLIEKGEAPAMAVVENAPEGFVADFTKVMSVDKRLLVNWDRKVGFTDEVKAREFARSLERFWGRMAFPDAFNRSLSKFRRKVIDKNKRPNSDAGKVIRSISEIRVRPSGPWAGGKVKITFMIILKPMSERKTTSVETVLTHIKSLIDGISWEAPFEIDSAIPYQIASYDDFSARDYIESYPLDLNALSFAARFQTSDK